MNSNYLEEMLNLPVQTNMRLLPPTISEVESISTVIDKMIKNRIGAVVIIEEELPKGIITERDVLERVVQLQRNLDQTLVKEVMSKPLISIEADCPMKEALELMRQHNIRRLVVTKDKRLVGLVTERRLLEVAFQVVSRTRVLRQLREHART